MRHRSRISKLLSHFQKKQSVICLWPPLHRQFSGGGGFYCEKVTATDIHVVKNSVSRLLIFLNFIFNNLWREEQRPWAGGWWIALILKCTFCYRGNCRRHQISLDWNSKFSSIKQTYSCILWKENPSFTLIISKSHRFFQETSVETVTKLWTCKNKVANQTKINRNKKST